MPSPFLPLSKNVSFQDTNRWKSILHMQWQYTTKCSVCGAEEGSDSCVLTSCPCTSPIHSALTVAKVVPATVHCLSLITRQACQKSTPPPQACAEASPNKSQRNSNTHPYLTGQQLGTLLRSLQHMLPLSSPDPQTTLGMSQDKHLSANWKLLPCLKNHHIAFHLISSPYHQPTDILDPSTLNPLHFVLFIIYFCQNV